jgi:hypothetical protein
MSCFLWFDLWDDRVYHQSYPELFSYVKYQHIFLSVAASTEPLQNLFHLPLSNEAFGQFQQFSDTSQSLQLSQSNDTWSDVWGSPFYSSRQAYKQLIGHQQVHRSHRWLWTSACQNKRKFFFWLILKDRLSTRALLRRKGM